MNLDKLFRDNYNALCVYALHYVDDIDIAEDIVMEQFVKLAEKNDSTHTIMHPDRYMYLMIRNACIDFQKVKGYSMYNMEIPDVIDDNIDDIREICEREARLWKQIDKLPPACKNILLMCKRDNMKYQEIADKLGISVKTVEAQIGKAYSILRNKAKEIYMYLFV